MAEQDILNLRSADPFADVTGPKAANTEAAGGNNAPRNSNITHIRIQQRNGRKTLTTVQVWVTFIAAINDHVSRSRVSENNSTRKSFFVSSRRSSLATERWSIMKNTAKWFNFKVINERTSAYYWPNLGSVNLNWSKFTDFDRLSFGYKPDTLSPLLLCSIPIPLLSSSSST